MRPKKVRRLSAMRLFAADADLRHRFGPWLDRFPAGDLQVELVVLFSRGLMLDFELRVLLRVPIGIVVQVLQTSGPTRPFCFFTLSLAMAAMYDPGLDAVIRAVGAERKLSGLIDRCVRTDCGSRALVGF